MKIKRSRLKWLIKEEVMKKLLKPKRRRPMMNEIFGFSKAEKAAKSNKAVLNNPGFKVLLDALETLVQLDPISRKNLVDKLSSSDDNVELKLAGEVEDEELLGKKLKLLKQAFYAKEKKGDPWKLAMPLADYVANIKATLDRSAKYDNKMAAEKAAVERAWKEKEVH